jgi:hypothetical protein
VKITDPDGTAARAREVVATALRTPPGRVRLALWTPPGRARLANVLPELFDWMAEQSGTASPAFVRYGPFLRPFAS